MGSLLHGAAPCPRTNDSRIHILLLGATLDCSSKIGISRAIWYTLSLWDNHLVVTFHKMT